MLKKKNDGFDLERILAKLPLTFDLMSKLARSEFRGDAYLRHDLCGLASESQILEMAQLEKEMGVSATYFIMPPGAYSSDTDNIFGALSDRNIVVSDRGIELALKLLSLGHEVGLHNNAVSLMLEHGLEPQRLFESFAEAYSASGVPLLGTASHGSPICREKKFNNREIFEGSHRRGWEIGRTIRHGRRKVTLHSVDPLSFGFKFEAYSLPRTSTLSDSGGRWSGKLSGSRPFLERQPDNEEEIVSELTKTKENGYTPISILLHPSHWASS